MVIFEVLGVIIVVGIVALLGKLLIAGLFHAGDKVVEKFSSSPQQRRPYWEEHWIDPYQDHIAQLNQIQKTAIFFKMVEVATVDDPLSSFERSFLDSFRQAFKLSESEIKALGSGKFATLSEDQLTMLLNGVLKSLSIGQKEWFLKVLDVMVSHGARVPTMAELVVIMRLADDIGVSQERYKEIMDVL